MPSKMVLLFVACVACGCIKKSREEVQPSPTAGLQTPDLIVAAHPNAPGPTSQGSSEPTAGWLRQHGPGFSIECPQSWSVMYDEVGLGMGCYDNRSGGPLPGNPLKPNCGGMAIADSPMRAG